MKKSPYPSNKIYIVSKLITNMIKEGESDRSPKSSAHTKNTQDLIFKNRIDAGEQLSEKLRKYKGKKDVIVLGIPRGGVEVASVISKKLHLPLDVIIIKKIGLPGNE